MGWFGAIDPFVHLSFSETALLYGLLGTLPLVLLLYALQHIPVKAFQDIQQLLMQSLVQHLLNAHWTDLLVLSAIAGFTEEVLFRGVVQPWIEQAWGLSAGLWLSSVLFGLVHAVTPLYAVLATLVSVYLGLSLDYGGTRNLLTPIVIHGLYDFLAFLLIIHHYKTHYLR
jgi:membrane protease YdiL (CAAX protease family)